MVEVRLGILNEHVQHLFAICRHISLNSAFGENGRRQRNQDPVSLT